MRATRRPAGVDVRADAVRKARLEARLSQAQLAGGELTRQAIHLIEKGRARPSPRTLELIAERTGKPISYFMTSRPPATSPDAEVRELQTLCASRQYREAVPLAREILANRPLQRIADEARFWLGQALVTLLKPDEALEHLEGARKAAERADDPWRVAECLDWEAGALYIKEDPRALAIAETALSRCRELDPRPPGLEARILEHLASIHARNRSFDSAVAYYDLALAAAEGIRDLARIARTYHGLSMAYQERGLLEQAAAYAQRALALYSIENDRVLIARAQNELGLVLMRQGEGVRAEELFRSALGNLEEAGVAHLRSHVVLSLAELELERGALDSAATAAREALELAAGAGERLAAGAGHLLLGRVLAAAGDWEPATPELEAAVAVFTELGLPDRLAEAYGECARAYEARGDLARAARDWRRAAELALPKLSHTERAAAG